MLSDKDKLWIKTTMKEVIEEELTKALTVKVRLEKTRSTETGLPLAVPEIVVKDVYLPAHWVEFLPFYESALRGVQETTDHGKNNSIKSVQACEFIANILIGLENNLLSIGTFTDGLNTMIENKQHLLIEK